MDAYGEKSRAHTYQPWQSTYLPTTGEIGILQYFPEFLLKVGFLHKKETPGQFHELEEKQQTKVFGKVNTFWTYHLALAHARGWCGPLVAHLPLSFWLPPSSGRIGTSGYLLVIFDLLKYGVLTILFHKNPDSGSEFSYNHQTCKIDKIT
jgi:hypothetical protein